MKIVESYHFLSAVVLFLPRRIDRKSFIRHQFLVSLWDTQAVAWLCGIVSLAIF
jgi:hypothetical protein